MKISVVIPTYNRIQFLKSCLASLEKQKYNLNDFEVIVVNDGSTDTTGSFLNDFKKLTNINFRFINQPNRGVSAARNRGIENTRAAYVALTDDDCILPDDWLIRMQANIDSVDLNTGGVGGPLQSISLNENSFISKFTCFMDEFNYIPVANKYLIRTVHVTKLKGNESIPYLRTSNAVFRKKCIEEIGKFDEYFKKPGGEDPDLCYRLLTKGYSFHFDPELIVKHLSRESFKGYFNTLKNYVRGEIRKSCKKKMYYPRAVRISYTWIPLQKIISVVLAIFTSPATFFRILMDKNYSVYHALSFPVMIVTSKIYALFYSIYFLPEYFRCKNH
jgi:glycosyltransferase involved in cell wall biosynthesis